VGCRVQVFFLETPPALSSPVSFDPVSFSEFSGLVLLPGSAPFRRRSVRRTAAGTVAAATVEGAGEFNFT